MVSHEIWHCSSQASLSSNVPAEPGCRVLLSSRAYGPAHDTGPSTEFAMPSSQNRLKWSTPSFLTPSGNGVAKPLKPSHGSSPAQTPSSSKRKKNKKALWLVQSPLHACHTPIGTPFRRLHPQQAFPLLPWHQWVHLLRFWR